MSESTRRLRVAATTALVVAVAQAAVAVGAGAASGLGWARLVDLFVVSNTLIGLTLAVSGWPIAHYRPHNPIGWSLLAGGVLYGLTAAGLSVLALLGAPSPPWRVLATVTNGSWTWAVALFIPLALVRFPDGRLPGRGWRWLVGWLVVTAGMWTTIGVLDPFGGLTAEVGVPGYPGPPGFAGAEWLLVVGAITLPISYLAALAALVVRYRRGPEQIRGQVLWLLLALLVITTCFALDSAFGWNSLLVGILPLLLIPVAITVAVLRYRLLDIRLVVSRTVLYLLLTGGVVAGYLALVALLDQTVRRQVSLNSSVLAAIVVALAFNPVRVWLQRGVHRAFYGARRDPIRAIAEVGAAAGSDLTGALEALCRVLRFPAAAVVVDGTVIAAHAELTDVRHTVALRTADARLGELIVGLRYGENKLNPADERILALLAAPLAVAVQATRLADELRTSREGIVTAREEERRRIRRDLHDGLGPVLTGVLLNADAARRLLDTDRDRSAALLIALRDQTIGAIEEIRRLVYELRPPALDSMGLLGALREYAAVLTRRSDGTPLTVTVHAPDELGELPAAVEVAIYRIATEALTNVARHSTASAATVRLEFETCTLRLEIADNGTGTAGAWQPGVGLTSIRERAAELGGRCEVSHDHTGAGVTVVLPMPVQPADLTGSEP